MFRTVSDEVGVRFLQSAQRWAERRGACSRGACMRRRRQSASLGLSCAPMRASTALLATSNVESSQARMADPTRMAEARGDKIGTQDVELNLIGHRPSDQITTTAD